MWEKYPSTAAKIRQDIDIISTFSKKFLSARLDFKPFYAFSLLRLPWNCHGVMLYVFFHLPPSIHNYLSHFCWMFEKLKQHWQANTLKLF